MRLTCEECKQTHNLDDDKLDDFNIYWILRPNANVDYQPHYLCHKCTEKVIKEKLLERD